MSNGCDLTNAWVQKPKKAAEPKKTTKEKVKNAAKGANPVRCGTELLEMLCAVPCERPFEFATLRVQFATPAGGIPAARSFFQQQSV